MTQMLWLSARLPTVRKPISNKDSSRRGLKGTPTLRSSNDSASAFPYSPLLRTAISRPALTRMPSTTALLSSRPVRVVALALSIAKLPKTVPRRSESEVDCAINVTKEATGCGKRVLLGGEAT
jgi:hypothetical protein